MTKSTHLLFAVGVFVSSFSNYRSRRVSSVPDVNPNISIDLMREDNIITSIYAEKVERSTKEKGETLMKHIEIFVDYMFRLFESYRRNQTKAVDVGESLVYQLGPMILYAKPLNTSALANKFNWSRSQVLEYELHYIHLQHYYFGINFYRWKLGYINNVGFYE